MDDKNVPISRIEFNRLQGKDLYNYLKKKINFAKSLESFFVNKRLTGSEVAEATQSEFFVRFG